MKVSSTAAKQNTHQGVIKSATSHPGITHGGSEIWTQVPHDAGPLRKEVLPLRDAPGGAVMRKISSENQFQVGQNGITGRTCSSSSLTLHSLCARRFPGGSANLHKAQGQLCASTSVQRGPRSGSHTNVRGRTRGRQPGLPELKNSSIRET